MVLLNISDVCAYFEKKKASNNLLRGGLRPDSDVRWYKIMNFSESDDGLVKAHIQAVVLPSYTSIDGKDIRDPFGSPDNASVDSTMPEAVTSAPVVQNVSKPKKKGRPSRSSGTEQDCGDMNNELASKEGGAGGKDKKQPYVVDVSY